jgi:hypothetical protein
MERSKIGNAVGDGDSNAAPIAIMLNWRPKP